LQVLFSLYSFILFLRVAGAYIQDRGGQTIKKILFSKTVIYWRKIPYAYVSTFLDTQTSSAHCPLC